MNIPFSPPDITQNHIDAVVEVLNPDGLQPDQKQKNLKGNYPFSTGQIELSA